MFVYFLRATKTKMELSQQELNTENEELKIKTKN